MPPANAPAHTLESIEGLLRIWDAQDLTLTQVRLLLFLNDHDGSTNAAAADYMGLTRPSVSALLDRLERRQMIRREISMADRRAIGIFLEERGRQLINLIR